MNYHEMCERLEECENEELLVLIGALLSPHFDLSIEVENLIFRDPKKNEGFLLCGADVINGHIPGDRRITIDFFKKRTSNKIGGTDDGD